MTRFEKADAIERELFAMMPDVDGVERTRLARRWMRHPYPKFMESLDAGYVYPDHNPVLGTLRSPDDEWGT